MAEEISEQMEAYEAMLLKGVGSRELAGFNSTTDKIKKNFIEFDKSAEFGNLIDVVLIDTGTLSVSPERLGRAPRRGLRPDRDRRTLASLDELAIDYAERSATRPGALAT